MYYIWALLICIILFSLIQYIEYQKHKKEGKIYNMYTLTNLIILFILYILSCIVCYFIFTNDNTIQSDVDKKQLINKFETIDANTNIDPLILKKIPDNFNIGFEPFDDID